MCETGTEFDYTKLNDHLKFTSSRTFEDEIFNDIRGNSNSRYDQYIAAGFLNLNLSLRKWNYTLGLRNEFLFYDFSSTTQSKNYENDHELLGGSSGEYNWRYKKNYLLPSTSVSYKINGKQMLTFVYKQNIKLPVLNLIQPYVYQLPTEIKAGGNMTVEPSKMTVADLSYILQPSQSQMYILNSGICYDEKLIYPAIACYYTLGLFFNPQNLADKRKLYMSLSTQNVFNQWLSLGTSVEVSDVKYLKYRKDFGLIENLNSKSKNHPNVALSLNGNISMPGKLNFNFIYQYNSSYITPQGQTFSSHYLNLVFDRSFMKDRIGTFLSITNPFHRMKSAEEYNISVINIQYKTISEATVIRLGLSYKI